MGRLGPLSIGDGPLMGRELLAADFSFANPNPIAEFGVPTTVGLSIGVVATVLLSGLMSGLTLGLLSLDRLDLEVMMRTGTAYEKQMAARLAPIVKYPHWVLATLVIFNTVSSVALPLCMDRLVSSVVALIVSSTAIVLFGEILPQAVCSRHGLAIGGTMAPMVRVLMWLTAPLSWPIGWLLDLLLGTKGGIFGRRQLMALVDLHRTSTGMGGPLTDDEFNVILGALDMTSKTAASNMTPLDKVFMLSTDELLDRATLQRVLESGHSRVPVYEGTDRARIQGLIITKELLQYVGLLAGPEPPPRIGDIELRDMLQLPVSTRMYHLLDIFQTGQCHMALLTAPNSEATGAAAAKWKKGRLDEEGEEGEDDEEEEERERKEVRSRRKRWRDKQRPRFLTLPSFGAADAGGGGGARGSPGGSPRGDEGGSRGSGDGSGSPKSPRSPRTAKDLAGGLLPCLGGDGAVREHGENGSPRSSGGGGSRPGSRVASGGGGAAQSGVPPGPGVPGAGTSSGGGAKRGSKRMVSFNLETAAAPSPLAASYAAEAFHISGEPSPREPGGGEGKAEGQEEEEEEQVIVGIITLEDVIEEMMGEEIVDETDAFVDNLKSTRVNARLLTMSLPPQLRRVLLSASLKRDAAVATAAALKPPARPKLKAWSTSSTTQPKAPASGAAVLGAADAARTSGEHIASAANSAEGAGGAAAAAAVSDGSAAGGAKGSSGGTAMGWFGWRPVTPTKPIRIGTSPGGSPGSAAGGGGSSSGAAAAAAAAGGSAPAAGAAGALASVNESPPRAAPAGRGPTRLSQMDRQQSA